MSSIITCDECWVNGYDPETKQMSSQRNMASSPRPKKAQQVKSNVKTMLSVSFNNDRLVHHEYIPRGQAINKEFYKTFLQRIHAVHRHHTEKWRPSSWILHHDNAPAHRAVTTNEFLAKHNIPSLSHPPYFPGLALCDSFLFPQLKKTMKGHQFDYIEEIQANTMRRLRVIMKSDYQRCFRQWQECWNKCLQAQGHYFEGDKTN